MLIPQELDHELRLHARQGGKTSRRRQVDRVRQLIRWCGSQGVRRPDQIGKRHVHQWLAEAPSDATRRDRYYAVRLLWQLLGRGEPTFVSYRG